MDTRELNALEIGARARIAFDGAAQIAPRQTTGSKYRVTISSELSYSCEDFQLHRLPYKRVLAAR